MQDLKSEAAKPKPQELHGILWLASYPKSGNTWTRNFLHNLLNILEGIRVCPDRRSQVVLVSTANQEHFVAKCFDPSLCPTDGAAEARQTVSEYCQARSRVEADVYERLAQFQGQYIPKFYGRYRYASATAILLEYIPKPSLDHFHAGLPESELYELLDIGTTALNAIHELGIFHYDIQASNVFWSKETKALRIVDWEFSRRDPPSDLVKDWAQSDLLEFRYALESCGLPKIPWQIPRGATWYH